MRISDTMMSANYLENLSRSRERLMKIQEQMASQKKIQQPSDSPEGTARVMDLQSKLTQSEVYLKNIENSITFIRESLSNLEQMDSKITDVLTTITDSRNANLNDSNLQDLANKIDSVLSSIMDYANSSYEGKYLFGGTDISSKPFGMTADGTAVEIKAANISGNQNVRISDNRIQSINLPGSELFSTIISQSGNLNSAAAVGASTLNSSQVYDAAGNAYTLNISYQKTAANTYSMTYDVVDGGGSSVLSPAPAAKTMVFDSATGLLKTVDGNAPSKISVKGASAKVEFMIDPVQITEANSAASINATANQKTSIFNTLISISDNLRNGIRPTVQQESDVQNFFNHLLNRESQLGNVQNQLESVQELLQQKTTNLQELVSNEMEVDMPKLLIDLQNQQYVLDMSYKMASMILPKSLMDFL